MTRNEEVELQSQRFDKMIRIIKQTKEEAGIKTSELTSDIKAGIINLWEQEKLIAPVRIEYVEKPFKTPKAVLIYQKFWKENQKQIKKQKDVEIRNQAKIELSLRRKYAFCYSCTKTGLKIQVKNPTYTIKETRNGKKRIIVKCLCPKCDKQVRSFGGYLET